jgi:ABC-type antimicrobial peptide transport system permease subunit
VAGEVRRAVADVLKTVSVSQTTTLSEQVDASIVPERLVATLSTLVGTLAAILVGIGLYGLLAFTVARRINEIGIRMTLGATKATVTRMVLKSAAALVAIGLAIGIPAAVWSQRVAAGWVGNLKLDSPLPIAFAVLAIGLVALLSAYVPAQRAARIDPAERD